MASDPRRKGMPKRPKMTEIKVRGTPEAFAFTDKYKPAMERAARGIAEHGADCVVCGAFTKAATGGLWRRRDGSGLIPVVSICLECNRRPEAEIDEAVADLIERLEAKGCN